MFVDIFFAQYQSLSLLMGEFLVTAVLVLILSVRLTTTADRLERATRLSEIWIGAVLLAFVTSLPEAVNSIGATFIQGALNLGVGNLVGSNMFNMVLIVVLDLVQGRGPILMFIKKSHIYMAAGGIVLMGILGSVIALHVALPSVCQPGSYVGVGASAVLFLAFIAVVWAFAGIDSKERAGGHDAPPLEEVDASPSRHPGVLFLGYAVLLILASVWMLRTCDAIARQPVTLAGRSAVFGHTFVGAFLVAVATSLPELFVSIGALKLNRLNMSIANLFGSNVMNMAFIPVMHLFVFRAGFYLDVSPENLLLVVAAITMSILFIAGLLVSSKKSFLLLGWETMLMLLVYLAATFLVFRSGVLN